LELLSRSRDTTSCSNVSGQADCSASRPSDACLQLRLCRQRV